MILDIEPIVYKGRAYYTYEFTDDDKHVEPCWYCTFGKKCFIGTRMALINGEWKEVKECGYACNRPLNFPAKCTSVNREDKRNVYFKRFRIEPK